MSDPAPDSDIVADASTWHPAFRPNSSVDLDDTPTAKPDAVEAIEFNKNDPIEFNSQNARSVEPDHGASASDPSGVADAAEAPSRDTVPNTTDALPEVLSPIKGLEDLDAQDKIDPAWGFEDTPKTLSYTNSFPPVPPLPATSEPLPTHPLSSSQAEAIMEEDEAQNVDGFGEQLQSRKDSWGAPATALADAEGDFFAHQQSAEGGVPVEPSDAEARFEEGIPLVGGQQRSVVELDAIADASNDPLSPGFGEQSTEDDFFANLGAGSSTNPPPKPKPLDRKSTEQVISLLEPFEHPDRPRTLEDTKSSDLEHLTGGGIAVSTSTVLSQVLADGIDERESLAVAEGQPPVKEDDLAALWEAALGDDELLEEDNALDPSTFFGDDEEGFLDDVEQTEAPTPVHDSQGRLQGFDTLSRSVSGNNAQRYQPQGIQGGSKYAPSAAPSAVPQQPRIPTATAQNPYSNYTRSATVPPPAVAGVVSTPKSFVDQAKGGYTSPFDAPMDLSRPKRRSMAPLPPQQPAQTVMPPPRSSSITSAPSASISDQMPQAVAQTPTAPASRPNESASKASFFEELPMAPKVRPPSTIGRGLASPPAPPPQQQHNGPPPQQQYNGPPPQQQYNGPPPQQQYNGSPRQQQYSAPPPPKLPGGGSSSYGLVAPERKMSFPEAPQQVPFQAQANPPSKTAPPPNTRYSPAPVTAQPTGPAPNRYAAPPSAGPPRAPSISNTLPFQPRTSSPLAHSSSAYQTARQDGPPQGISRQGSIQQSPPPSQVHHPMHLAHGFDPSAIERPQVTQRGSIQDHKVQAQPQRVRKAPGPPIDANFLPPTDERANDPLKRWQGAPIVQFGFGGSIVTSFPRRLPRFITGQTTPSIMCAPGQISVHTSKLLPLDELITTFPGPLKSKAKKKDVIAWLDRGLQHLEYQMMQGNVHPSLLSHPKRYEERILLWKIVRIMVEFDGNIETNPAAVTAVREALSPELKPAQTGLEAYTGSYQPSGIIGHPSSSPKVPGGAEAVEQIRKLLLNGDREKAVWHAVDQRLWGHAMLIASTLSKDIWKQVTQDFVKNDVKTIGDNVEPLAALYDVFSGNWEETVDQLVPSSARAGLPMVSKTSTGGPTKNAFDGLNHWRETLTLILGNRSVDDVQSLAALGQMLSTYGRIEAAHICYLFSRLPGLMSGADDPQAAIVLLGENHRAQPVDYAQNLSSVLLTEVYEFATCVLATPANPSSGHLQSFKLWHATMLAESGHSDQAQQYCEAIAAAAKGSIKASPYYHSQLLLATDDLSSRLQSAPRDASGSWISKPNMDKVSGSVWNKFTQFVAGDDSDAGSAVSKAEAEGPFARIAGDTPPSISRGPSPGAEQYGTYGALNGHIPAGPPSNSRYAPKAIHTPQMAGAIPKQPSYASMSSVASAAPGQSHNYQPPMKPVGGADRYSPASASHSPEASFHQSPERSLPQRQMLSEPTLSPPKPEPSPSRIADAYQPQPSPERRSSPYEPRPAAYAPRSSSYAPRPQASPSQDRDFGSQQSPSPYEPTAAAPASYQAPDTGSDAPSNMAYPAAPTISQVPPTPTAPTGMPNAGYEPSQPSTAAPPPPGGAEHGSGYAPPGFSPTKAASDGTAPSYAPPESSYDAPSTSYNAPVSNEESSGAQYAPPSTGYEPPSGSYEPPSGGYEPPSGGYEPPSGGYEPPSGGYEPPSGGYEPPGSGYAPPSAGYDPSASTNGAEPGSPPKSPRKKKSFMDLSDDEDDLIRRAEALKKSNAAPKAERPVDDAVRRAAEADAERDRQRAAQAKTGGWLGGWFSRGNADNGLDSKKPIKARLGEESSFYYDANLKKWVNKKAGADDQAAAAAPTPPPPKGPGPPRAATPLGGPPPPGGAPPPTSQPGPSSAMGPPPLGRPPSNPVSRTASPAGLAGGPPAAPPAGDVSGPIPGIAPPSRPGTGMSGLSAASSIDDLLGAPQARKGGTVKKAKKGRGYVDVMAK